MDPRMDLVPTVIEQSSRGERSFDLYSRLLRERIIFIGTPISDQIASLIIAQLLFLESDDPERDIYLYINCPGGAATACLAIYDTMQYIKAKISTVCIGQASGLGAFLVAAGSPGKRFMLPNSRLMLHQPRGGATGQATDIEIQANEILKLKKRVIQLYSYHTGRSQEDLARDLERNLFMSAEQAKNYGLIDEIMDPRPGSVKLSSL